MILKFCCILYKKVATQTSQVRGGRATQIHVFPLSFDEFYSHVDCDERKALDTHMLYGGMPRLLALTDEKDKKESSELASLMLTKDFFKKIVVRMDIPHNFYNDNGIFHCNLIDLLLGRVELL